MERSVLRGLAVFRWAAWGWMAVVLLAGRDNLRDDRAAIAVVAVGGELAITIGATALLRTDPARLLHPATVAVELAVGVALLILDGVVYREGHAFAAEQNLGVAWPLFGVLSAGLAFGPLSGAVAGVAIGSARLGGTLPTGSRSATSPAAGGRRTPRPWSSTPWRAP